MDTHAPTRLRRPAFAREVISAREHIPLRSIDVLAHIGRTAWSRARRHGPSSDLPELWRLVILIDHECSVTDYDFEFLDGMALTLNAHDCDYVIARACATRMCEHGARLVILTHPAGPRHGSEWFYGVPS